MPAHLRAHAAGSVLGRIVSTKIADVAARESLVSRDRLERALTASDRDFARALRAGPTRGPRPVLIAEIKRRSPSRGDLRPDASAADIARIYDVHAAAISVVCDTPFFGGNLGMLAEARAACSRPILMKDFVIGEYQVVEARAMGADAILL